jgi:hypothetical protein
MSVIFPSNDSSAAHNVRVQDYCAHLDYGMYPHSDHHERNIFFVCALNGSLVNETGKPLAMKPDLADNGRIQLAFYHFPGVHGEGPFNEPGWMKENHTVRACCTKPYHMFVLNKWVWYPEDMVCTYFTNKQFEPV